MSGKTVVALAAWIAASATFVHAQGRDDARPRDLQRLHEDLQNLDESLQGLEPGDRRAESFKTRAEEIREEAIYLKVKMRKHERAGREGTGVSYDEVSDLQRSIRDLRDEIDQAFDARSEESRPRAEPREARLPEGTEFELRLDQGVSSRTARREDRVEASIATPVRSGERLALPAGTRVRGVVKSVEPAERPSKEGRLELEFDTLYLDKERLSMLGRVTAVGEGDGLTKDKAGKAGIGAVLGGVVGSILGGKKGAIIGGVLGGTGAVVGTKGEDVELPAGAIVRVRLSKPLVLPRR